MTKITSSDIDQLNEQAWNIRISDSTQSLAISTQALEKAKILSYRKGKAAALRTLGFCNLRMSNYKEAQRLLIKALEYFEMLEDAKGQSTVYEYLGIVQRNFGDLALSLESIQKALELSRKTNFIENEITNLYQLGVTYRNFGLYEKALEDLYESLQLARDHGFPIMIGYNLNVIGSIHFESEDFQSALENFEEGLSFRLEAGDQFGEAGSLDNIGAAYLKLGHHEKATHYFHRSFQLSRQIGNKKSQSNSLIHLAEIQRSTNAEASIALLNEALSIVKETGDARSEIKIQLLIAEIKQEKATGTELDLLLQELDKTLDLARRTEASDLISETLYRMYQLNKILRKSDTALLCLEKHLESVLKMHHQNVKQKIQNIEIAYQAEQSRKEAELLSIKNRELKRLNKKTNEQKQKIEETLKKLEETQTQLIHSEKMASLGQLTAGIAHEIRNPLNFVNNFAELNQEIADDLINSLGENNIKVISDLAHDLKSNSERIHHHGNRADLIMRSMLQHSRSESGKKELTDINALCKEYMSLAYHGIGSSPRPSIEGRLNLSPDLPSIQVVPQDIGRVLLNIISNAYQAVLSNEDTQQKCVEISTSEDLEGNIIIEIKDNGPGVPEEIQQKIFDPFFTTKPPNEGTGLGLSLSYDIVRSHGGTIDVQSESSNGTSFIIKLPK